MAARSIPPQALLQTTVANKEITFYVARDYVTALLWALRDDESLRFELASSISGVDYGEKVARRLHVVYDLTSMTYRRRIRLEVAVDVDDAHVPVRRRGLPDRRLAGAGDLGHVRDHLLRPPRV